MADWRDALAQSRVLDILAPFDPRVAGTFPLGLTVEGSDIDVLCHAPDAAAFAQAVWQAFAGCAGFAMHQWAKGERAVVAAFTLRGVPFEIFGSPVPVAEQVGWRHFEVERRLLELGGPTFRDAVMQARATGAKTEPAFAQVLGLPGDPYAAMLALSALDDADLRAVIAQASGPAAKLSRVISKMT